MSFAPEVSDVVLPYSVVTLLCTVHELSVNLSVVSIPQTVSVCCISIKITLTKSTSKYIIRRENALTAMSSVKYVCWLLSCPFQFLLWVFSAYRGFMTGSHSLLLVLSAIHETSSAIECSILQNMDYCRGTLGILYLAKTEASLWSMGVWPDFENCQHIIWEVFESQYICQASWTVSKTIFFLL